MIKEAQEILKEFDRIELELHKQNNINKKTVIMYKQILQNLINEYQKFCEKVFSS